MEPINATKIDWTYLRFQYEILGMSAKDISEETPNLSEGLIEQAIKEGGWVSGNIDSLVPVVQNTEEVEGSLEAFTAATKAHLVGANLVKQRALFPSFAKCEAILLSKVLQAANSVDATDEKACNRLTNLVKAFQGLLAHNSFLTMQTGSAGDGEGKIVVQVLQQVN